MEQVDMKDLRFKMLKINILNNLSAPRETSDVEPS